MLAHKEYKRRFDNLARIIYWNTCGKYKLMRAEKWYEHQPKGVIELKEVKLLWDFNIQCDKVIEGCRPDKVMVKKREKIYLETAGRPYFGSILKVVSLVV